MKKLVVLLLLLLWPAVAARGESWTVESGINLIYHAEQFEGALPETVQDVLKGTPFAGDRVLQGVVVREDYKEPAKTHRSFLLLAAEHQGTVLLIGGLKSEGMEWKVWPASETFLRDNEEYTISAKPRLDKNGDVIVLLPAVVYADGYYMIGNMDGYSDVASYVSIDGNGNGLAIIPSYPDYCYELHIYKNGERTDRWSCEICLPARLELMDADAFPRTKEDLDAWAKQYPLSEAGTYVFSANLREKPTGKSRSMGVYRKAPATILDSAPGTQHPWYKLRIGDTEGWMSGVYVAQMAGDVNHGLSQVTPPGIAQCNADTSLYLSPGGQVKQALPVGTAMHIIADCDGWYHVVLPREDITWKLDAEGTYGYVRVTDVTEYTTLLNMKYGVGK